MLKFLRAQLDAARQKRTAKVGELEALVAAAERETRGLTTDETTRFDAIRGELATMDDDIKAIEARVADAETIERRQAAADAVAGRTAGDAGEQSARVAAGDGVITREPMVYGKGSGHSYFLDLARSTMNHGEGDGGPGAAAERMSRHGAELRVELPKREAQREQRAQRENRAAFGQHAESAFEKRVNPNRTDGQGGNFVPPLWLVDEYIDLPRFGRVLANSVRNLTLPAGTDSINLPKISTGTTAAVQTADAGTVSSTDLTDTSVTAPVRTIAGQQDIAIQLLDQSPVSFDEVVYSDLMGDYNLKLDTQCWVGTGSSGQFKGILSGAAGIGFAGTNNITYTDATPTLPELYPFLLQAVSQVAKLRKIPPQAIFTTPSIWYWGLSQLDTTNRPLMQTDMGVAFNPAALQANVDTTEGYAGKWTFGLPQMCDGNIPSNLGAGTNETRAVALRTADLFLWEGAMRSRALSEVLSNTLQVRLQVYNYAAFMPDRRPEAISVVSGTGLIPTAGF